MSILVEELKKKSAKRKQEIVQSFITQTINDLMTQAQREAHHGRSSAEVISADLPDIVHRFDKDSELFAQNTEYAEEAVCRKLKEELIREGFNQFLAEVRWVNKEHPTPRDPVGRSIAVKTRAIIISCSW